MRDASRPPVTRARAAHWRPLALHGAVIAVLFGLQFVLPEYHHLIATRIMLLAVFANGYNLLYGYTGLLSLGHALFFATGMYTAGLSVTHFGVPVLTAFGLAIGVGVMVAALIGAVALRTRGVAFMIVTLMFSQVAYLTILYFNVYTRGDEGFVLPATARSFHLWTYTVDLTDPSTRYFLALGLLIISLGVVYGWIHGTSGRALRAVRENELRTHFLGYNTFAIKLNAVIISGGLSAAAGAAYALLFAYIGASFAGIAYSIDALLFTLLGGAGTVLGPLLGSFLMFYLIDSTSQVTGAYLLPVGVTLIVLIVYCPQGILGTVRDKWLPWLP